jgi:tRNA(Ile)-lysidine synthase
VDAEVARVLDAITAAGLRSGARIVVLLSGGRDSVCLLDGLTAVCGPAGLLALHINYGL